MNRPEYKAAAELRSMFRICLAPITANSVEAIVAKIEQLIDEKVALYDSAVPGNWLLFYTHDTKCAASRVVQDDKGRYSAFEPLPKLSRMPI